MIRFSFLNKVIRTSESVSFNKVRNMGRIYSLVPFLPITGANDNNEVAIESYLWFLWNTSDKGIGIHLYSFK